MAAAWFKGVQRLICLDYNDALRNPLALLTVATIVTCTPQPITAHHSQANIAVTFALCLPVCFVQEETVKIGFCHKSVRKQQVWLLRNRGSCVRDAGSDTDSDRDL